MSTTLVGLERILGSDPGYLLSCGTCQSQRQYWLIWNSSHDKNAEKFCGHGKFGVVVDTYSKSLCLWITLLVMQVFSGGVLQRPEPDSTRTWIFLNSRYRTSTWFFILVPPLTYTPVSLYWVSCYYFTDACRCVLNLMPFCYRATLYIECCEIAQNSPYW